ncbi:hypothetical protein B0T14DRAFT_580431 [Immersiella caudata]|uniref:Uncharacterized protein n=1 Tax=Immersiella caudata TaxID=314043 RepID=A0AA39WVV0_9PEZI|nr:hypothetical protein B0T14DRAFT_580431 [Immersiella caudata]
MKQGLFGLAAGITSLQLAAAKCCNRNNQCLKAIISLDGIADCSSYLATTVTIESIFTSAAPIEKNTITFTETATVTDTTIASTETLLFITSSTITASTETELYISTVTSASTETSYETLTSTTTSEYGYMQRRIVASSSSSTPEYPAYASPVCPSWEKYVSACQCAQVTPTTITVVSGTVTVDASSTITSEVDATSTTTETSITSETTTTETTTTNIISVTTTTSTTETTTATPTVTTTVTTTTTATVQPSPPAKTPSAPFRIKIRNTDTYLTSYFNVGMPRVMWKPAPSSSASTAVLNTYLWQTDGDGRLREIFPSYGPEIYYVYNPPRRTDNWNFVQGGTEAIVEESGGDFTHVAIDVEGGTFAVTLSDAAVGEFPVARCSSEGDSMRFWMYLRYGYTEIGGNQAFCPIVELVAEFVE